jgi:dTMP kinase
MARLVLRSGSLIVLEGLDRSGKSTQAKHLATLDWSQPIPTFTHMPSGFVDLTKAIYGGLFRVHSVEIQSDDD